MTNFVGLRAQIYSYIIDDGSEDKKEKDTKKCVIKRKIRFENYNNCLGATQLENNINHVEKDKIDIYSLFCYIRKHKEFIRKNKIILKTQQRFKSEGYNAFTKEINKTAGISNLDNGIQSIDSIETYAYGTSKDLVSEKEEIKCNNIMKPYKK